MALVISTKKQVATPRERWEDFDEEIKFLICSLDCDEYRIAMERARRLMSKQDAGQTLESVSAIPGDALEIDVQARLAGSYLVKGWAGPINDENGNPVAYSAESAAALLKADLAVLAWVFIKAGAIAAEAQKEADESVKKSLPATDGKSSESA